MLGRKAERPRRMTDRRQQKAATNSAFNSVASLNIADFLGDKDLIKRPCKMTGERIVLRFVICNLVIFQTLEMGIPTC